MKGSVCDVDIKTLTDRGKLYKLEMQKDAILCPYCRRPFRVVRADAGTRAENLRLRCSYCKREIAAYIDGTSARYSGQRR